MDDGPCIGAQGEICVSEMKLHRQKSVIEKTLHLVFEFIPFTAQVHVVKVPGQRGLEAASSQKNGLLLPLMNGGHVINRTPNVTKKGMISVRILKIRRNRKWNDIYLACACAYHRYVHV